MAADNNRKKLKVIFQLLNSPLNSFNKPKNAHNPSMLGNTEDAVDETISMKFGGRTGVHDQMKCMKCHYRVVKLIGFKVDHTSWRRYF